MLIRSYALLHVLLELAMCDAFTSIVQQLVYRWFRTGVAATDGLTVPNIHVTFACHVTFCCHVNAFHKQFKFKEGTTYKIKSVRDKAVKTNPGKQTSY